MCKMQPGLGPTTQHQINYIYFSFQLQFNNFLINYNNSYTTSIILSITDASHGSPHRKAMRKVLHTKMAHAEIAHNIMTQLN